MVQTTRANLVAGMRWFLGTYTARFNRRSYSDLALHVDPSLVSLCDSENGCQAKAGSFSDSFGGEERLEDTRLDCRRHAATGVLHA